jgi:hypothetical protein
MERSVLHVVREETLSPRKFLHRLTEQRSNIARVEVKPPRLGKNHFGRLVVRYKHAILKPMHGR